MLTQGNELLVIVKHLRIFLLVVPVEMVDAGGIDLVLMDIKMPIMDGLEATAKIKETHPELPVVALTANAFDSDRQLAMNAGCNDFLSKPVNSEKCLATIAKYLGE